MIRILLACSAGMSTSMLVEKMKDAAISRCMEVDISAVPVSALNEDLDIGKLDCLLIGPQAAFGFEAAKEYAEEQDCPAEVIPQGLYGSFDGEKVLDFALDLIEKYKA